MKEYQQLQCWVQHSLLIHHFQTLISPQPSTMRSMAWSSCPRWERPKAPLPLHIKAIDWPPADEIDACNDDLIVAIIEVMVEITIPTENHLILPKDLFRLNPKQLDIEKMMGSLPFLSLADAALGAAAAAAVARNRRCSRRRGGGGSHTP